MIKTLWPVSLIVLSMSATACGSETTELTEAEAENPSAAAEADGSPSTRMAALMQSTPTYAPINETLPDYDLPDDAWRTVDQDNLLYIDTDHGRIIVEMAPEFAPNHVERMRELADARFYDGLVFHRVIDGFMAQAGGARTNPAWSTDLPDMQAEFTTRRDPNAEPVVEIQDRMVNDRSDRRIAKAGFWNGFPIGTDPSVQAAITGDGRVNSWLLHCQGAAAMARTSNPDSAGSQFYITRGNAEHLNAQYTVWGRVRVGQGAVDDINVGTMGENPGFQPDTIRIIRVGSDLPEEQQVTVQVADTNSAAFASWLDTQRASNGELPDICEIDIPVRIEE
ncbi:peptidylprolyl isomerase [Hyphobacterium sp. SN044]|uniref:peptidylprolyl isomerase n=1 Tax=Hyphobacterium sp. SN044 TaxID=2912575 RepID=UPI001F2CF510|nr:peptidylprolyl isomerase [Hyphobacterium sp. SN044]